MKVTVQVANFKLADKMGEKAVEGEGHIIYYIWNGFGTSEYEVPTSFGKPANAGGTGYVAAASAKTIYEWSAPFVRNGRQDLVVQLVNNDHTPLDPPQVYRVTVSITGVAPASAPPPSTPKSS